MSDGEVGFVDQSRTLIAELEELTRASGERRVNETLARGMAQLLEGQLRMEYIAMLYWMDLKKKIEES